MEIHFSSYNKHFGGHFGPFDFFTKLRGFLTFISPNFLQEKLPPSRSHVQWISMWGESRWAAHDRVPVSRMGFHCSLMYSWESLDLLQDDGDREMMIIF